MSVQLEARGFVSLAEEAVGWVWYLRLTYFDSCLQAQCEQRSSKARSGPGKTAASSR